MNPKTTVRIAALTSLLAFAAMAPANTLPISGAGTPSSSTENSTPGAMTNTVATLGSGPANVSPVVGGGPNVTSLSNSVHASNVAAAATLYERALGFGQRWIYQMGQYAEMESGATTLDFASNSSRHGLLASAR